ncbi:MAG: serine protease [Alphaproteobacteria bacterium]|nr:serine protease [Alphaproteobacteria bacterium]
MIDDGLIWREYRSLLATNRHCLPDGPGDLREPVRIRRGYALFGYQAGLEPQAVPIKQVVYTHPEADFALVELQSLPWFVAPLELSTRGPADGQSLYIFHHPEKLPKMATTSGCLSLLITPAEFRHVCDTLVGSSGAPILSTGSGQVVGIHYRGPDEAREPGLPFNGAWRISCIVKEPFFDRITQPGHPEGIEVLNVEPPDAIDYYAYRGGQIIYSENFARDSITLAWAEKETDDLPEVRDFYREMATETEARGGIVVYRQGISGGSESLSDIIGNGTRSDDDFDMGPSLFGIRSEDARIRYTSEPVRDATVWVRSADQITYSEIRYGVPSTPVFEYMAPLREYRMCS